MYHRHTQVGAKTLFYIDDARARVGLNDDIDSTLVRFLLVLETLLCLAKYLLTGLVVMIHVMVLFLPSSISIVS